ncbi:MAG: ABC transporter permease subunit [Polyangiaceae bacterium]|nr:ABC transporter permease subunit [Polyangiaceae bacterium]
MSPMLTIAKRELRSYFDSAIAYVVISLSLLALGALFFMFRGGFWQVDRATMQAMFDYLPVGLLPLVVPVVTMRLLAEEKRSGTLEMLITLPVKDSDVILGKYFGALALVLLIVSSTLAYPLAMFKIWKLGVLDWGPVFAGYLGLVLLSAAAVALGLLVSAIAESQMIALFVTILLLVGLYFVGDMATLMTGSASAVIEAVSFRARSQDFGRGLVSTRDVVFFLSVTALALAVAFRALERRKWA